MENKVKVFWWWSPKYYLKKPWKLFKDFYWGVRTFVHRGRYGWAHWDVWNMDEYLLDIIPMMLRHLANNFCGYPGTEPYETPEKYKDFLIKLAEKFEYCQTDDMDWDSRNEYADAFHEQGDRITKRLEVKDDYDIAKEMTAEEREIRDKYFARMMELWKENDKNVLEAYTELAKNHNILRD